MITFHLPLLRRLAATALAAAALTAGAGAAATTVSGNVTHLSSSTPHLNATDTAWAPFDIAQGAPNASKSIQVLFIDNLGDTQPFPLNASTAVVKLRPATVPASEVICIPVATAPVLTSLNAGTCTYRVVPPVAGTSIEIFYLGLLKKGENIRYQISGLKPAVGTNTISAFDSDAVLPGISPSPTLGRKPARLVLVLDKSGSMDWSAKPGDVTCGPPFSPTPACRRFNILKSAAAQLANVAKAYTLPDDKLGVVLFDSTAHNTGGIGSMTNTTLDAVSTALLDPGNQPGGSTSIGAGVTNLVAAQIADNATFNNVTLLFTDGEQNTAPFLVSDGSSENNDSHLRINSTINQPYGDPWLKPGNHARLCVFRLRPDDPTGPGGTTTLQQIATQGCGGLMNSSATLGALEPELIQYFLQVLNTTLVGDKLELLKMVAGERQAGSVDPVVMPFKTSKKDLALTLLLRWDREFLSEGAPELKLTKDGVDFFPLQDPAFIVARGTDHVSLTLRTPFCNSEKKCVKPDGDWSLSSQVGSAAGVAARGGRYNLFVLSDNETIASSYAVTQATPGVGQPLTMTAKLTEGNAPLAGLAAGAVRAFISGPAAGLGNVLSASTAKPGAPAASDPFSAAGLKVQAMLADPNERAKILQALALGAEQGIPLVETTPGTYSAPFPATLAEGIYRVSFRIAGTSPGNSDFTRLYNTDFHVPVVPDSEATNRTLVITRLADCTFAGGCVRLVIRPIDAKGNLVGPGKTSAIYAPPFKGQFSAPTVDNLDGTYTVTLGYTQAGAPPPVITVGGFPVILPPGAGSKSDWLHLLATWWWIILLAILLILWMTRHKKQERTTP